jgi:hypothetical protein
MPIYVAMADSPEPEPSPGGERPMPEVDGMHPEQAAGSRPGDAGLTPEELARVVRRLETGYYDRPEVRDQIARRALDDLAP